MVTFTIRRNFNTGLFAEELTRTPAQTEGPFYPNKLPLDTDNDLILINDKLTPDPFPPKGEGGERQRGR